MNFKNFFQIISILIIAQFASCALLSRFSLPKGYVPDDKVVFLKQKIEFGPIRYDALATDPYVWEPSNEAVNAQSPYFLSIYDFNTFSKPDYTADTRLYKDVSAHFEYILNLPAYNDLKSKIENARIDMPQPYPLKQGDKVNEFTNATEYTYPGIDGATITTFNNGNYQIEFSDKSIFLFFPSGSYRLEDADKKIVYQVWTGDKAYTVSKDGFEYRFDPSSRSIEGITGKLSIHTNDEPQVDFSFPGSEDLYIFFKGESVPYKEYALERKNGLRFDYFPDSKSVLITYGSSALTIESDMVKYQSRFNERTRKAEGLVSYYLPEGIRLTNLDSSDLSYSDVNPAWPEKYISKQIGPFNVLYTKGDEPLLGRISAAKLTEVDSFCKRSTGLSTAMSRTIVVPPNLESYRKLHSGKEKETMIWYPSGFQTKDIIVMWPISVPRYNSSVGQDYFFAAEFYEILAHEYTHLMVGEASGILNSVPVWLNEGIAVYVESQYSEDSRTYWDITFEASKKMGRILPWNDVTVNGTAVYPIAQARVHYAQSYAMVKYLISTYGTAKVSQYIRSFRTNSDQSSSPNVSEIYKPKFASVFGTDWDANLVKSGIGGK